MILSRAVDVTDTSLLMNSIISILRKIPRLHLFVAHYVLLMLFIQSALRLIFFLKFSDPTDPSPTNEVVWSFYLGLKYDLQFALILSLPVLLAGWVRQIHPVYSSIGRKIWTSYFTLTFVYLFLFHATNFGFYSYLGKSIDASSLRFLENPLISAGMVWETYPVITGGFLITALVASCYLGLKRLNDKIDSTIELRAKWRGKTLIVACTVVVVFMGLFGKLSWYPLRWSDAFFSSSHPFTAYLASNPSMYFYNTLKNKSGTYDVEKTRHYYPLLTDFLGINKPDIDSLNFTRKVTFDTKPDHVPANVVIVVLESFASYLTGLSGNPLGLTPNIDRLAGEGVYFKNFYIPAGGTARSIWQLMTGIPDIEKNSTSTRNPLIVNQKIIMDSLEGFEKYYFLGGSVSWGNIRGLLTSSIEDLVIYEEGSYEEPRVDVWGLSDLSLFREANKVFKKMDKPFFGVIQTSGNHRPYTIPDDNDGFRILTAVDLEYDFNEHGIRNIDELNAIRFMDHSVGRFIEMAKKEDYFENTIFMFFGDHGITFRTGDHVHKSESLLNISAHRVPYIIYSPKIFKEPRVVEKPASSLDVMPTAASLTQTDYTNTTLGRDLFDEQFDDKRYVFTVSHGSRRQVGLLSEKFWFQMQFDESGQKLLEPITDDPRKDVSSKYPEVTQKMGELTRALNEATKYIRENNKKISIKPIPTSPSAD